MTNLHTLAPLINQNARNKGFYADRDHGIETRESMMALTHSELSEALECVRASDEGEQQLYFVDKQTGEQFLYQDDANTRKPEGLPAEIADVVIRALDYAFFFNMNFLDPVRSDARVTKTPITPRAASAWIARMHDDVAIDDITSLLNNCYDFAAAYGFDLDTVIAFKMAYNEGRPTMHGDKKL